MKLEIFAEDKPAEKVSDSLYFPFGNRGFSVLSDLISVFFGTGLCYNF